MPRIVTAKDQLEMLGPFVHSSQHTGGRALRLPQVKSNRLDDLGITQRKLNGNFMSWMDTLSDRDKQEGGLWYPTGNDWVQHASDQSGVHPDKISGVLSKTSPQQKWPLNVADAQNIVYNHGPSPHLIQKPSSISGTDNLRQAMRVMGASDDPDDIHAAFLGTKNVGGRPVPRIDRDLPKTYDFWRNLRDPEEGGAGNHMAQPGVVDSWMSRTMLWSKDRWDDAKNGGRPLTWPGKGTGEGLDKPLPVKGPNPETGNWEVRGQRAANPRDVAARIVGYAGGYDRMRNAMRNGASVHDMPFVHGAQAAVWKQISKNDNPAGPASRDPYSIEHPADRWDEMWRHRASGLVEPRQQGLIAYRTAAHGDPNEIEDTLDEGWGTPEDHAAIARHLQQAPPGWDHWEGGPGLSLVQDPSIDQMARPPRRYHPMSSIYQEERAARLATHLAAVNPDDYLRNMDVANEGGTNPWTGAEAEGLRGGCNYCGADAGEPCDPRCPTHHSDDPAHWRQERALMGPGGHFEPGAQFDPMQRLNSVADALAYSAAVVKNSAGFEPFGPEWQDSIMKDRAETGGYSRRPDGSKPPPRSFMVSEPHDELKQPMDEFSAESAADYGRGHQDRFEKDPDLYQGGWGPEKDPEFYHDLSKAHDDMWNAADAAYDHDQHAFYDTHTGVEPSPLEFRGPDGTHGLWMAKTASREGVPDCLLWT